MLGFAPYSAAAFADLGSGEQLFIPTGVEGVTDQAGFPADITWPTKPE